jgi:hypothetical protein
LSIEHRKKVLVSFQLSKMKTAFVFLALLGVGLCKPQDVVAPEGGEAPAAGEAPAPADGGIDIAVRAPSSFQNCDCQCDSYTWTSNGKILGNCLRSVCLDFYVMFKKICF